MPGTIENSKCSEGESEGDGLRILQDLVAMARTLPFTLGEVGARTMVS